MTTYYVDSTMPDDSGNGLTPATAKKTLNGAEDIPVVAGDHVWVRPGVYREQLNLDVSGSEGSPITYQGDVAGQIWHPGGVVRITGSDDDVEPARNRAILAADKDYRTFRSFSMDSVWSRTIDTSSGCSYWNIEDVTFFTSYASFIRLADGPLGFNIKRCFFFCGAGDLAQFSHSEIIASGSKIENCIFFIGANSAAIATFKVGSISVLNCRFMGGFIHVETSDSPGADNEVEVYNSIFDGASAYALIASAEGDIIENHNVFFANAVNTLNISPGANSLEYSSSHLQNPPILLPGYKFPWSIGGLSQWSQIARRTDSGSAPADDFYGLTRPVTNGKRSWGPIQFTGAVRDTTITHDGSEASLKLPDAGMEALMMIPIGGEEITISLQVYREADYAGDLPQLIVRQPGQADQIDTDTGDEETWNELSVTFTPAALPKFVQVFVNSRNTASSGDYATYWDSLTVT